MKREEGGNSYSNLSCRVRVSSSRTNEPTYDESDADESSSVNTQSNEQVQDLSQVHRRPLSPTRHQSVYKCVSLSNVDSSSSSSLSRRSCRSFRRRSTDQRRSRTLRTQRATGRQLHSASHPASNCGRLSPTHLAAQQSNGTFLLLLTEIVEDPLPPKH